MLVEKWMTRSPVTIQENESLGTVRRLMKEKKIRRLPVLAGEKLVGIVTDRDFAAATPSQATSLDVWEIHSLLEQLKVRDIMSTDLATIRPGDTVEKAALLLIDRKIEGLPVVTLDGALIGILTQHDVFRALVGVTGATLHKTRVSVVVPDEAGTVGEVTSICRTHGRKILSILVSYDRVPVGTREVILRTDADDYEPLRKELAAKFGSAAVTHD